MPVKKPTKKSMPVKKKTVTDAAIIKALEKCGGIKAHAAKLLKLTRAGISYRIKKSKALTEALQDIEARNLDIAESELMKKIKDGNLTAIIFFLKCKGKSRGYVERQELAVEADFKGGVMIVPGMAKSVDEWLEKYPAKTLTEEKNHAKIH